MTTHWTVNTEEDPDTGDLLLTLPDDLMLQAGWSIGDVVEWTDLKNGSWQLTKKENTMAKISDKLTKVNDNFTVNMYDNGFMVEIGGRDSEDDWKNSKILCNTLDELIAVITEATTLTRE